MITLDGLRAAWRVVRARPRPGADGLGRRTFERDLERRLTRLRDELIGGSYRPGLLLRLRRPKPDGGERLLSIPGLADRVAQRALLDAAQPLVDRLLLPQVHGFRPGRSPDGAVGGLLAEAALSLASGLPDPARSAWSGGRGAPWERLRGPIVWERAVDRGRAGGDLPVPRGLIDAAVELVKVDVRSLFDELPIGGVVAAAAAALADPVWRGLTRAWVEAWPTSPGRGVPQGAPLSPMLANLYLDGALDRPLEAARAELGVLGWIRFGDDLCLIVRARAGVRALAWLDGAARRAGLELSPRKTVLTASGWGRLTPARVLGRSLVWS